MKMASRSIDLITQKKKKIGGAAHFFLIISKKKNKFVRATRFLSFFAVVLHNYNAAL